MQALDPPCNPSIDPPVVDSSLMPGNSSPIHSQNVESNANNEDSVKSKSVGKSNNITGVVVRRERPSRACTQRAAARMQAAAEAMAEAESKRKKPKKRERIELKEESEEERLSEEEEEGGNEEENGSRLQYSKIVTPLGGELEPSQLPRWNIRSMWQLASILNFLNVFRPLLKINVEFSAEEFETALLTPNNTLGDVHMPLLKAIPPVTRIALGHGTWVTVLCKKLRNWWHWVAEGDLPIVAAHGAEVEAYNALDPGVRVVILKALCDIRVEQDDIRSHIDNSIKQGVRLSAFRKERIGGDSHGVSYWYEDDPVVGHRLYREIRKVEVKKGKGKNVSPIPHSSYHWEAVATNLDEFVNVSEKLITSKNRTEVSVGKKLQNNMLPEIEMVHKRKEKQLKKQHRQALMLDNMMSMNGIGAGRSLRDRKPVTYTFDDYDRSISEALKVTKKQRSSPEPSERRDPHHVKHEVPANGRLRDPPEHSQHNSFTPISPNSLESLDSDEVHDDQQTEALDRSNRRRQRPQRYSVDDFVEAVSDNEAGFDSDDDIVGEAVYDDEYLSRRKQRRKTSSSSEGDDEYHMDEENPEEEEEEEEDVDNSSSVSEESGGHRRRRHKPMPGRTRRETKLRSVGERQPGLRRSNRATRNRIDYRQIEMSESDTETMQPNKSNARDEHLDVSEDEELSVGSQDSDENMNEEETYADQHPEENREAVDEKQAAPQEQSNSGDQESDGVKNRHFLDLNELAPGSGIDEGPPSTKDENEDEDDF